jgi:carbonic anhydrase
MVLRFDAGSALELDGHRYELIQVHAHAPSEHTIDGRRFPAEMHLVHQHASGQLAVLAVLLDEGAENPDLRPLLPPFPDGDREEPLPAAIPPMTLLPVSLATYRYEGSLTTPPCTEGVRWLVLSTPLPASPAQLTSLAEALGGNSRPVQPRAGREVYFDAPFGSR